jgi:hypothetical protein
VIKESESTEDLQVGPGWSSTRSGPDDDLVYGLQELGPLADPRDGKNYTIVVSAGGPGALSGVDVERNAGLGGIKATTMITQQVESGDLDEKRLRVPR